MAIIQPLAALPDLTRPYNPRDILFMSRDNASRVIATLDRSSPVEWYDYLNVSSAFFVLEHTDLALLNARQALALDRNSATLLNLAVILETLGGFYPAFSLSEEAYALDPGDPFMRTHYSDALLRMGRLAECWPIYSASHANWEFVSRVIPEWDGVASLEGKRILVLSGGGYGDNFLHLRWMPRLAALGAHVTFMCPSSMHSLLDGTLGISRLIAGSVAGLEGMLIPSEYDYHTCVLSLGGYFCPTMEDIPTKPYVTQFAAQAVEHTIGLCTEAGEESFPRRHRTLTDEQVNRIFRSIRTERKGWFLVGKYQWKILNHSRTPFRDWTETAEHIAECELIVTVDTGVAHLAGAMEIPCWVLLPGMSASYYGVSGSHCAFYPSHRLFHNFGEGIDNSVSDVCAALAAL